VPFSPSDLSGLAVWLDASQLGLADGADVSPWPNPGSGPDGAIVGSPAPKVNAGGSPSGLPVVRFTVSAGRLRMTGTGIDLNYTLVYVGRMAPDGYSAGRIVNGAYQPANILFGWWNGYEDVAYAGTFLTPDARKAVTTNWHLYSADAQSLIEVTHEDYMPRLFSDGALLSGGGVMTEGWKGTFSISGYDPTAAAETCDCEVAEVVMYDRKLSDAERQQVEGYLHEKWLEVPVVPPGFPRRIMVAL
jgi:hypothetical protein